MSSNNREINSIILAGDYPKLTQKDIGQVNYWLKKKFGARFQCQNSEEANRLIKTISAWTRHYKPNLQIYIDNEIWQGQKMDALAFQNEILAKDFKRNPLKRKAHTVMNMLREMLKLFCPTQQCSKELAFERNKHRNFIASSKLEGIHLDEI